MLFDCRENDESGEVEKCPIQSTYNDSTQRDAVTTRRAVTGSRVPRPVGT
jgi:hypothetical protein